MASYGALRPGLTRTLAVIEKAAFVRFCANPLTMRSLCVDKTADKEKYDLCVKKNSKKGRGIKSLNDEKVTDISLKVGIICVHI